MHRLTVERAAEIGLPVVNVPGWYDVDDAGLAARCSKPSSPASRRRSRRPACRRASARHARAFLRAARCPAARRSRRGDGGHRTASRRPGAMSPLLRLGALAARHAGLRRRRRRGSSRTLRLSRSSSRRSSRRALITIAATRARRERAGARRAARHPRLRARHAARCSSATSRCCRPTSIATSGTAACRRAGINPYAYVPADPALAALRDAAIYPNINRADYAVTAYPPVAQMFFLAVTRICRDADRRCGSRWSAARSSSSSCIIDLLRQLAAAGDGRGRLGVAPAGDLGDRQQRPRRGADGRADDARRLAAGAQRALAGAVAVALAALVKPYAVVILPAFWRPWDWRVPLAVVATIVALLSALSRCRPRRARLRHRRAISPRKGFASGEGILARRARAALRRQGAGPDRRLPRWSRRRHGLARRCASRSRAERSPRDDARATSPCC